MREEVRKILEERKKNNRNKNRLKEVVMKMKKEVEWAEEVEDNR